MLVALIKLYFSSDFKWERAYAVCQSVTQYNYKQKNSHDIVTN